MEETCHGGKEKDRSEAQSHQAARRCALGRRDAKGRIKSDDVGRSSRGDRRAKAETVAKPGQGEPRRRRTIAALAAAKGSRCEAG